MHTLTNKHLSIAVKEQGAELTSLKSLSTNMEYIWQANPEYWARHAPVLFPIVGRLKDDTYILDDKQYNLRQHGFARDRMFELFFETENSLCFVLKSDKETFMAYPFRFKLYINYILQDNQLTTHYNVVNEDDKLMYFSIGGHPAFNCPLVKGEDYNDYYIEFQHPETADRQHTQNDLLSGETERVLTNQNTIVLHKNIFNRDAFIFKDLKSTEVSLKSRKSRHGLTMNFKGFPYLGIWAKQSADFVCFEPWYGVCDSHDTNRLFQNKQGIMKLQTEERFECSYTVTPIS